MRKFMVIVIAFLMFAMSTAQALTISSSNYLPTTHEGTWNDPIPLNEYFSLTATTKAGTQTDFKVVVTVMTEDMQAQNHLVGKYLIALYDVKGYKYTIGSSPSSPFFEVWYQGYPIKTNWQLGYGDYYYIWEGMGVSDIGGPERDDGDWNKNSVGYIVQEGYFTPLFIKKGVQFVPSKFTSSQNFDQDYRLGMNLGSKVVFFALQ